jgi:hypothetical protein
LPTVVITGVGFPGHEGQSGVPAAHARQTAARAEDVHLDRLRREAEQARDFLGLQVAGDQAQNLALTRRETLEAKSVDRFHHAASMRRGSRDVQRL